MEPLNMYLEHCSTEDGIRAVKGYGRAILQLAQANIFPGDMMTKNFGLTRQKRVVFYDYYEIEFLTDRFMLQSLGIPFQRMTCSLKISNDG